MKKAVVLLLVVGAMIVLVVLAMAALNVMTQESRVAEHKIGRMRAYYAAEAAKVDALERLRRGLTPPGCPAFPPNAPCTYVVGGIGRNPATGVAYLGYPAGGYNVRVYICRRGGACFGVVNAPPSPPVTLTCPAASPSEWCVFTDMPNY
jgi:hypothetical protein